MLTDERIEFVGYKRELTLIESLAYGGNSGAPVFVKFPLGQTRLIGVLNGYFNTSNPIQIIKTSGNVPVSVSNIGIAAITPSYFINETLDTPEVKSLINNLKNLLKNNQ